MRREREKEGKREGGKERMEKAKESDRDLHLETDAPFPRILVREYP